MSMTARGKTANLDAWAIRGGRVRSQVLLAVLLYGSVLLNDAHAQESLTLRKIEQTGAISIGYRVASTPFSYIDDRQRPIGYSMDLCHRVVDAIKAKLKLRHLQVMLIPVTSATRIPLVANGTVDLECGVTTNNLDRQKKVSFSLTTFVASSRFLTKKPSRIETIDDLKGKTVVSTVGTTSVQYLQELNRAHGLDMNILAGKDDTESFLMLDTGRAVAYAMDDVLLRSLVAGARNPAEFTISEDALSVEPYGIVLGKGDPVFKKLVDTELARIFKSGEIHAIYAKWFQSPIPLRGANLQMPMSSSLQKVVNTPTDSGDPADYK